MSNKTPWDDDAKMFSEDDEACIAYWKRQKASDFYFAVIKPGTEYAPDTEGHTAYVLITPTAYFTEFGYMWDQWMDLDHLWPGCVFDCYAPNNKGTFSEAYEGCFEFEGSATNARKIMLKLGFIENAAICDDADMETLV